MDVAFAIGMLVMMPVMADPPQRSVLRGENAEHREEKLKKPAGPKRPMGKQAMEPGGDAENLQQSGDGKSGDRRFTDADNEHQRAGGVQNDQRCEKSDVPKRKR